jgi:hypothetical protein
MTGIGRSMASRSQRLSADVGSVPMKDKGRKSLPT